LSLALDSHVVIARIAVLLWLQVYGNDVAGTSCAHHCVWLSESFTESCKHLGFARPFFLLFILPSAAYIEKHIIKNSKSLFKERAPPLDIVLYAIRLLLGASTDAPRLGDIPDLLDFATTIEFYRKLALQKVDEALTFQRYYEANNDGHTTLTDEEIERLHQYTRDGPEVRTVYIEMILQYCQWVRLWAGFTIVTSTDHWQDIYHLWTSDPPCPTDVTLRLCEYFPNLNGIYRNKGATSPRLFHYDLTDAEREVLRLRGIDSCMFVSDSCDWASARQTELPGCVFPII
jgi:hypothetical protein